MGLAISRLVVATNSNDIMARALNDGVYASGPAHPTLSPSMDIQVASNFERALFEAAERDAGWTAAAMQDFARDRRLALPPAQLNVLRTRYSAFASDDPETRAAIAAFHARTGRIIDPHTAVGFAAILKMGTPPIDRPAAPTVLLATAHPAKFPDAVAAALGAPPPVPPALAALKNRTEKMEILPPEAALIQTFISSRLPP
jgi:threonine synthase